MRNDFFQIIVVGFLAGILLAFWITNAHIAGLETQSNEILNRVLLIQLEVYGEEV
jgi:uncharacterized membrane protein